MERRFFAGTPAIGVEEKIGRVERLLRRLEEDKPYLNARFSKLGSEHRSSAYAFAERVHIAAETELQRLLAERKRPIEEGVTASRNRDASHAERYSD